MNTTQAATVANVIKEYRTNKGLNQKELAKSLGMSSSQISVLENLSINKVTPGVHTSFLTLGVDLKEAVPGLIVEISRGKDRRWDPDISVPIKKKDPLKLLEQARDLVKDAVAIINSKVTQMNADIEDKKEAINELENMKKDILSRKDGYLTEIIDTK